MSESKHTKEDYVSGWSHLIGGINFDNSAFDAEAIVFMYEFPGRIMNLFDNYDALLADKVVLLTALKNIIVYYGGMTDDALIDDEAKNAIMQAKAAIELAEKEQENEQYIR